MSSNDDYSEDLPFEDYPGYVAHSSGGEEFVNEDWAFADRHWH